MKELRQRKAVAEMNKDKNQMKVRDGTEIVEMQNEKGSGQRVEALPINVLVLPENKQCFYQQFQTIMCNWR